MADDIVQEKLASITIEEGHPDWLKQEKERQLSKNKKKRGKLTYEQRQEIEKQIKAGVRYGIIAQQFHVTSSAISAFAIKDLHISQYQRGVAPQTTSLNPKVEAKEQQKKNETIFIRAAFGICEEHMLQVLDKLKNSTVGEVNSAKMHCRVQGCHEHATRWINSLI